ncbi:hypothetical protein [Paractinoplanes durhamensis]|uniref:NIF system FeS cluster assembly NifU C-terminal domain-containing protein n=1 Tax=Paractinoplanes durhamensis TaxID=113563 RepID=A0ABQ3YYZ2_9ACTN|nr:hypothetical protein [Actinoplanes durhamensis]GIE02740.1 hypothetical protein Adu01nite_40900 [Actinoplanes durhamensis]
MTSAVETNRRIDQVLAQLGPGAPLGEELIGLLLGLYGDGLARITAALGPAATAELCADPLIASLLLVHDLHPVPLAKRIVAALAGTDADLLGVDDAGVAHLRVRTTGCGVSGRIEAAVRTAAPEVTAVDVVNAPPLLQISRRPGLVVAHHPPGALPAPPQPGGPVGHNCPAAP